MKKIKPKKLYNLIQEGKTEDSLIVDVRSEDEYGMSHIIGARNVHLSEIENYKEDFEKYDRVYIHCNSGNQSSQACKKLDKVGLDNMVNIEGGLAAWKKHGLPTEGSVSHGISLNRQVMISAGSLILLGFLLAYLFSRWFLFLPAFVGAGLLFAGLSGHCMMAKILTRMPWNE
ncbi:MAG: rhodanese-like domain-containing protein [Candidatus Magasanikbacteria bacterium]